MADKQTPAFVLVDDDEDDRYFIRQALHQLRSSYPVVEFANGSDFIDYLKQELAEKGSERVLWMVLMDINMPLMNGVEVLKTMRQHPLWKQVPVIMFTSLPDQDKDLISFGATACIPKPLSVSELSKQMKTTFAPWLENPIVLE
ncbi:response regulator [Spirosoma linguale]|uniref:Response regulator receiver protein n=1 Tax=Spirosoma linguale (strain ATCC 33905 / DSM 74 / LMG 10896 / Claus 1) TaxID=504472 RepID=D2QDI4_SPILD|nr:response regulator receiver protein [Spirosoma linguale DSM 74]